MKRIFLLILIIIISSGFVFAQDTAIYLTKNYCSIIENKNDTGALLLLQEDILTKQVFTFGESHWMKGNSNIYKTLFFSLNLRGVKHIVLELPFGWNYLIKDYLNTGDSIAHKDLQRVMTIGSDWMQFFEWIYKYNVHLSSNEKITIDFIDTEGEINYNPSIRRLQMLLFSDEPAPVEIAHIIKKIKYFKQPLPINKRRKLSKKRYKRIAKKLYISVNNNDALYKDYLKENYDELKKLSEGYYLANYHSLITLLNFVSIGNGKMSDKREKFMYERYVDLITEYKNEKIFSVHGKGHINKKLLNVSFSVIELLNKNAESPVKEKVCAIGIDYINEDFGKFIVKEGTYPFLQFCKEPLTLFKLNGENTPFKELSKTIQYLIINKY